MEFTAVFKRNLGEFSCSSIKWEIKVFLGISKFGCFRGLFNTTVILELGTMSFS